MASLSWKETYALGVDHIDDQHRHLFDLLGQLQDAVNKPDAQRVVGTVIKELVHHTQIHFRDEEKLMAEVGYHDITRHKELHKIFVERIILILRRLKAGQDVTPQDLAEFLERWMIEHLLGEDVKIAFAVKAKLESVGPDR